MSEPTEDALEKKIKSVMYNFRLGQQVDEDGDHTIQLSDALSSPDDGSITTGLREVEDLITDLYLALKPIVQRAEAVEEELKILNASPMHKLLSNMKGEFDKAEAEVPRLRAACAEKDKALVMAAIPLEACRMAGSLTSDEGLEEVGKACLEIRKALTYEAK